MMAENPACRVVVVDADGRRGGAIARAIGKNGFEAFFLQWPPEKGDGEQWPPGGAYEATILILVADAASLQRGDDVQRLAELLRPFGHRDGRPRRALVAEGELNEIARGELDRLDLYRVADAPDRKQLQQQAVSLADELALLDRQTAAYVKKLEGTRCVRQLLGVSLCLVDSEYRIWFMDAAHLGMTGGGPLEGQKCWFAFHGTFHQRGHCDGCAIAGTFEDRRHRPRGMRMVASQVARQMRFFTVAGEHVATYSRGRRAVSLCAEFSCDVTDTPAVNSLTGRQQLGYLVRSIASCGFARARAYHATGAKLEFKAVAGYEPAKAAKLLDRNRPPLDARGDPYCLNTLQVERKPKIYSPGELGEERYARELGKQHVRFWMEFPFFDARGGPIGLLAIDDDGSTGRHKSNEHLLEVQQIADAAEGFIARSFWMTEREEFLNTALKELLEVGYDQASLWDYLGGEGRVVRGRMCITRGSGPKRSPETSDVEGVTSSLYHELFLYEAAILSRVPMVFERERVNSGSRVCKDYVARGARVLVYPLLGRPGRLIGFLIIGDPVTGRPLGPDDIARLDRYVERLRPAMEETQPFLRGFSGRPMPVFPGIRFFRTESPVVDEATVVRSAIGKVIEQAKKKAKARDATLRLLHRNDLVAVAPWTGPADPGDRVDVRDETEPCAEALRLPFPKAFALPRKLRARCGKTAYDSLLPVVVRDTVGTLGTLELFTVGGPEAIRHDQRDWAQSLAGRLGPLLRFVGDRLLNGGERMGNHG